MCDSFRSASDVWYSRCRNRARVNVGLSVGISVTVNVSTFTARHKGEIDDFHILTDSTTTVLFRTTLTWTIMLNLLQNNTLHKTVTKSQSIVTHVVMKCYWSKTLTWLSCH